MKDVFISYKSEEFDEAKWVKTTLEQNGISCWMAPDDIPGGSSYASEIMQAIRGARIFVLILSEKAQTSPHVAKELDIAINAHMTVLPFELDFSDLKDDFYYYLSNVQRYAAYSDKEKAIERMIADIKATLNISDTPAAEVTAEAADAAVTPAVAEKPEEEKPEAPKVEELPAQPKAQKETKPQKEKPVKAAKAKKEKTTGAAKKSKKLIILPVIAVLIVALIAGIFLIVKPFNGNDNTSALQTDYEWETADTAEVYGALQTDGASIKDSEALIIHMTTTLSSDVKALKQRLDALGTPYAVYVKTNDESKDIYIKTTVNHMSEAIVNLLCTDSLTLQCDLQRSVISKGQFSVSDTAVSVPVYSDFADKLKGTASDTLYLATAGGYPLFAASKNDYVNNSSVEFADICYVVSDKTEIKNAKGAEWLFTLLNTVKETGFYADTVEYDFCSNSLSSSDFGMVTSLAAETVTELITPLCDTAEVTVKGTELSVVLNLNVDLSIAQKTADLAENIYKAVDFENSFYTALTVYPLRDGTKSFINFHKNTEWTSDTSGFITVIPDNHQTNCIELDYDFNDEALTSYDSDLAKVIKNSSFYSGFYEFSILQISEVN